MTQDQSASRYRPATLVECLVTIKARLSDLLSPAEQRELQQAIEYIGNNDEPRSEQLFTREQVETAIDAEPELPGEMPDAMWEAIRNDRHYTTEAMRIAVKQTKSGIKRRLFER